LAAADGDDGLLLLLGGKFIERTEFLNFILSVLIFRTIVS
jgi:hypothetical protein